MKKKKKLISKSFFLIRYKFTILGFIFGIIALPVIDIFFQFIIFGIDISKFYLIPLVVFYQVFFYLVMGFFIILPFAFFFGALGYFKDTNNLKLLKYSKIILFTGILIFLIFFTPTIVEDCGQKTMCYGRAEKNIHWIIDLKESTIKPGLITYSCKGIQTSGEMRIDGCRNWGFDIEEFLYRHDIDCEELLQECNSTKGLVSGVECSEWERVCKLTYEEKIIPIKIQDRTQVSYVGNVCSSALHCGNPSKPFPGFVAECSKFQDACRKINITN